MNRILILFAHPLLEKSRVNKELIAQIPKTDQITFRDLYELYPGFNIDVNEEKDLLEAHDIVLWQHPLYWYSSPPLLKQWIDLVLEYGWAYGSSGTALEGKKVFNVLTAGGARHVYCDQGYNRYTIREFLRPFEQTACLCRMEYLPPFAVQGTHRLQEDQLKEYGLQYRDLLERLMIGDFDTAELHGYEFLNDWLSKTEV